MIDSNGRRNISITIFLSASIGVLSILGFWVIFSRHLHVSGDEVHFYFLSLEWLTPGYRPSWEAVIRRMTELQARTAEAAHPALGSALFTLTNQPDFFLEYKIPRIVWTAASIIVAGPKKLAENLHEMPDYAGTTMFLMFSACAALAIVTLIAFTFRAPIATKIALILVLSFFVWKEMTPWATNQDFQGIFAPAQLFLHTLLSADKDTLLFSFSARSNSLWLLLLFFALRWSAPRGEQQHMYYLVLPFISLVHSSQGGLIATIILLTDMVVRPARLFDWRVAGSYSAALLLSLSGGQAKSSLIAAALLSGGVILIGLAIAAAAADSGRLRSFKATREKITAWPSLESWRTFAIVLDGVLVTGFGILILLCFIGISGLIGSDHLRGWQAGVLGQRLGAILAVFFPAAVAFALVSLVSRRLHPGRRAVAAGLASVCLFVVGFYVIGSGRLMSPADIRARLANELAQFDQQSRQPLSFTEYNELHLIWWGITRSAIESKKARFRIRNK